MQITRTVYGDKDGIIAQLQEERQQAAGSADLADLPRYKAQYWTGVADGLSKAIRLLEDWAGEEEPASEPEPAPWTDATGITPATMNAVLFTTDGVVRVNGLPAPPPASGGKLMVRIPYPADERRRTVYRVSVVSVETGAIGRVRMPHVVVDPGEILTLALGPDNIVPGPLGSSKPFTIPDGEGS